MPSVRHSARRSPIQASGVRPSWSPATPTRSAAKPLTSDLSERRADTIKRYLVEKYGITGADLVTVGYGKDKPKDANAPMDPINRRVQVVNMDTKTTASR